MWHRPARLRPSRLFTKPPCHQDIETSRRAETKRGLRTTYPSRRAVPWHCWLHSSCRNSTLPRKGYTGPL